MSRQTIQILRIRTEHVGGVWGWIATADLDTDYHVGARGKTESEARNELMRELERQGFIPNPSDPHGFRP